MHAHCGEGSRAEPLRRNATAPSLSGAGGLASRAGAPAGYSFIRSALRQGWAEMRPSSLEATMTLGARTPLSARRRRRATHCYSDDPKCPGDCSPKSLHARKPCERQDGLWPILDAAVYGLFHHGSHLLGHPRTCCLSEARGRGHPRASVPVRPGHAGFRALDTCLTQPRVRRNAEPLGILPPGPERGAGSDAPPPSWPRQSQRCPSAPRVRRLRGLARPRRLQRLPRQPWGRGLLRTRRTRADERARTQRHDATWNKRRREQRSPPALQSGGCRTSAPARIT